MISRHSFMYAPPMLGHSPFVAMNQPNLLGQGTPAAAPQTVIIQAPPGSTVITPAPEEKGVSLLGLLLVTGAVLVALEIGGVVDIFGLDKLQQVAK